MLRRLPTPLRFLAAVAIALFWAVCYVSLTAVAVAVIDRLGG
ncbi:MAG TPA: hypothetical protein VEI97_02120 [bacterium]|nr:hypothetical protein [bacterium]